MEVFAFPRDMRINVKQIGKKAFDIGRRINDAQYRTEQKAKAFIVPTRSEMMPESGLVMTIPADITDIKIPAVMESKPTLTK